MEDQKKIRNTIQDFQDFSSWFLNGLMYFIPEYLKMVKPMKTAKFEKRLRREKSEVYSLASQARNLHRLKYSVHQSRYLSQGFLPIFYCVWTCDKFLSLQRSLSGLVIELFSNVRLRIPVYVFNFSVHCLLIKGIQFTP